MLWNASTLRGFAVEATDGQIGTVSDFLFDDQTWQLRWLVVHTGPWLLGREVLLPLSALGKPSDGAQNFTVQLTKRQVQDSPDVTTDLPVSRQLEAHVYDHYNWDPYWQSGFSVIANIVGTPVLNSPSGEVGPVNESGEHDDPHLRSVTEINGYHMEARDGAIGHAENFVIDDSDWHIVSVIVDTQNWLPGQHVLTSPRTIHSIDWVGRSIILDTDMAAVRAGPPYIFGMLDERSLSSGFSNDDVKVLGG